MSLLTLLWIITWIIAVVLCDEVMINKSQILEVGYRLARVASHHTPLFAVPAVGVLRFLLPNDDEEVPHEDDEGPVDENWSCLQTSQRS